MKMSLVIIGLAALGLLIALWMVSDSRLIGKLESGKRPEGAREKLKEMVSEDPDNIAAHGWLLKLAVENENSDEVDRRLTVLDIKAPNDYFIQSTGCDYLLDRREYKRAAGLCRRALKNSPEEDLVDNRNKYASALMKVDRYETALSVLKEAQQEAPNNINVLNNLGYCYMGLKDYDAAEEVLQKAISLDPDFMQARLNLARCYYEADQWEKSVEELEKVVYMDPDNGIAHMNLAIIYKLFLLENEQASIHSRRAIELGYAEKLADHMGMAIKEYKKKYPVPGEGLPPPPEKLRRPDLP